MTIEEKQVAYSIIAELKRIADALEQISIANSSNPDDESEGYNDGSSNHLIGNDPESYI